jgi:hypothetical protein
MKGGIGRRDFSCIDQVRLLKGAFLAKTHGADISASKALDATIELSLPELKPGVQIHSVDTSHFLAINLLSLWAIHQAVRKRFFTFTGLGQFIWTSKPDEDDLLLLQLLPFEEFLQSPFVTSTDKHRKGILWIFDGQSDQDLIEGISGIPRLSSVAQRKRIEFLGIAEEMRHNMAVLLSQS